MYHFLAPLLYLSDWCFFTKEDGEVLKYIQEVMTPIIGLLVKTANWPLFLTVATLSGVYVFKELRNTKKKENRVDGQKKKKRGVRRLLQIRRKR